jgi:hypothetical protein
MSTSTYNLLFIISIIFNISLIVLFFYRYIKLRKKYWNEEKNLQ